MSLTVEDHYTDSGIGEFEELLDEAEMQASTDWEMGFVANKRERYREYGCRMFISEKEIHRLQIIAGWE